MNDGTELRINRIRHSDLSDYTCVARNGEGRIHHTVKVVIAGGILRLVVFVFVFVFACVFVFVFVFAFAMEGRIHHIVKVVIAGELLLKIRFR